MTSTSAILEETEPAPPGASESFPFIVDSTLKNLSMFVTYQGNVGDVDLALIGPDGLEADVSFSCNQVDVVTSCATAATEEILNDLGSGEWWLDAFNVTGSEIQLNISIVGNPLSVIPYDLQLASKDGPSVEYPRPILLTATVSRGLRITGVDIRASVAAASDPVGSERPVYFVDDGSNGDWIAEDGIYSAVVDYDANDTYTIKVTVRNDPPAARFTTEGSLPLAPSESGETPVLPPLPSIDESFSRTASIQVVTSGIVDNNQDSVPDDDYPNAAPGKKILPDNTTLAGRIETTEDIDVFTVPTDGLEFINLRVSALAIGMEPELYVERETLDGLFEEILPPTTIDQLADGANYLTVSVPVDGATTRLHAFVGHATGGTGYYEFSAGPRIVSDAPVFELDIKPGTANNPVNPKSRGRIPVAILGSAVYDVRGIDPATLAFGPNGAPRLHPKGGVFKDLNGDSREDYLNFYSVSASGIMHGDTQACLSGVVGGVPFTACDAIRTLPRGKKGKHLGHNANNKHLGHNANKMSVRNMGAEIGRH